MWCCPIAPHQDRERVQGKCLVLEGLYLASGMPAANHTGDAPPLRISRTGVSQVSVRAGANRALIRKSPSASSATRPESCSVAVAAAPQNSDAKTLAPAFVPMPLPAARSRPRPLTRIRPSAVTDALRSAIRHCPDGLTPRTTLRLTAPVAATPVTGMTPIPP